MLNLTDQTMWRHVAGDLMTELKYAPYAILFGVLVYFVIRIVSPSRDGEPHHFIKTLLLIYLFALVHITLLEREPGSRTSISLTLFETIGGPRSNAYVIENVLLFMPFGFFAAFFIRPVRNVLGGLAAGALCSLAIETVQLITQRGHFQVDDIWTNSIGMGIGCMCYWLFRMLRGMIRHIYQ